MSCCPSITALALLVDPATFLATAETSRELGWRCEADFFTATAKEVAGIERKGGVPVMIICVSHDGAGVWRVC